MKHILDERLILVEDDATDIEAPDTIGADAAPPQANTDSWEAKYNSCTSEAAYSTFWDLYCEKTFGKEKAQGLKFRYILEDILPDKGWTAEDNPLVRWLQGIATKTAIGAQQSKITLAHITPQALKNIAKLKDELFAGAGDKKTKLFSEQTKFDYNLLYHTGFMQLGASEQTKLLELQADILKKDLEDPGLSFANVYSQAGVGILQKERAKLRNVPINSPLRRYNLIHKALTGKDATDDEEVALSNEDTQAILLKLQDPDLAYQAVLYLYHLFAATPGNSLILVQFKKKYGSTWDAKLKLDKTIKPWKTTDALRQIFGFPKKYSAKTLFSIFEAVCLKAGVVEKKETT